ncbi:DUF1800 domain-containing protein [Puniceicoccaceae bacterium K14]|nr:DUF1800 domain-containing protein [Puniceicoccaceae bacterium K14]
MSENASNTLFRNQLTLFSFAFLALGSANADVDIDGNNLRDVWEIYYGASELEALGDEDNDGISNQRESQTGTDPFDSNSYFKLSPLSYSSDGSFTLRWFGADYQHYLLQTLQGSESWSSSEFIGANSTFETQIEPNVGPSLARVVIPDDSDSDGLSDYEERLLGFDPNDAYSAGEVGDMAQAIAMLTNGDPFTIGNASVAGQLPNQVHASRFLAQASLGADLEEINRVTEIGMSTWIDEQFDEAPGLVEPEIDQRIADALNTYQHHRSAAWWRQVMTSGDLLRQRIALALSEIYVVSDQVIFDEEGMANYYDMLLNNAFGNWRNLIKDVTLHPTMGRYLSHFQNRKADPNINRYPDENYAREIMQLFSIGLFELNQDGTQILDDLGQPIPAYDNGDITTMARVFTGLSSGGPEADTDEPWGFFFSPNDSDAPMKIWEGEHDTDEKLLLNGITLPSFEDDPERTAIDDIDDTLDMLFNHPNTPPFVSRLLIQRLVTSNPSPEYIGRVSAAFINNGNGTRGDMKAVIKAILLDNEARSDAVLADSRAGRLREPYLRWIRLVKTFNASSEDGTYNIADWNTDQSMGQKWMRSPSVFNFFKPDHAPSGSISNAGMVAPEFEILTATTSMATQNHFNGAISWGFGGFEDNASDGLHLNTDDLLDLLDEPEELVNRLDLLLACGQLSQESKDTILGSIDEMPNWFSDENRVSAVMRLVMFSPDFSIYQ